MNYKFVVLKIEKGVTGKEDKVYIHKCFPSDKALNQHFYFEMDTTPTSVVEYHKAYYQRSTDSYFAPIPNQEYKLTEEN